MMQTTLTTKQVAAIGEEIGLELGTQMVKAYQESNPTDVKSFLIGRNIIDQILAQPGCVGIRLYNAINEVGEKTLVYAGIDENEKSIVLYSVITSTGELTSEKGIVADRIRTESITDDDFWTID